MDVQKHREKNPVRDATVKALEDLNVGLLQLPSDGQIRGIPESLCNAIHGA